MQRLFFSLLILPILIAAYTFPSHGISEDPYYPEPLPKDSWVDSLIDAMTLEQKIGQLIMVRANLNGQTLAKVFEEVSSQQVGGVIFFKGNPGEQASLTRQLQTLAQIPLFVAIDGEWGLGMRIDSAWSFPKQMTLGAISDNRLIYAMGAEIARQCREMGIHINFAPVVDVNSNPNNPVINTRSFGERPELVAAKGVSYMKGLQDHGVMAVAKHFPGHGDTDKDSHFTLPRVKLNKEQIKDLMLPPFEALIKAGVDGIMTAHLEIPALEKRQKLPATLSEEVIHKLLQRKMNFKGLVFTDALEMKGIANYVAAGEVEIRALLAGNDILLLPLDATKAIAAIYQAVQEGRISEKLIDHKCRKVLLAKRAYQVDQVMPMLPDPGHASLNAPICTTLSQSIYEQAITVLLDPNNSLPLSNRTGFMATLAINGEQRNPFQQMLDLYGRFDHFNINATMPRQTRQDILASLADYPLILLSLHGMNDRPQRNFGLDSDILDLIKDISSKHKVILTLFGNPYAASKMGDLSNLEGLVVAYEDHILAQQAAAQVIMGSLPSRGQLPVSAHPYPAGAGITYPSRGLLHHTTPLNVGANPIILQKIDSLAQEGIIRGAYPGCQILAAKDGQVFYHKSFGYQDYEQNMTISNGEIYDLASLTKILATTLAVMHLHDEGKLILDQTLGHYLPRLKQSNKEKLVIRDVLAHQAGLKPWIPYHRNLREKRVADPGIFAKAKEPGYSTRISQGLYLKDEYSDSLWVEIISSPLEKDRKYKYSDLGMILLGSIIEVLSGHTLDQYLDIHFYQPMGLSHTSFNPGEIFCLNNVVPTEMDTSFRGVELRGDVHDPTAALMGGVAGHAGLFSNALDVAAIMQMLLNGGSYGGKDLIKPQTIDLFTRQQFPLNRNRRGLGFDKPEPGNGASGPCTREASQYSYGHSGFTGTYAWADPSNGLVYVFLSNRTWPHGAENLLARLKIRQEIHSLLYQSIK